MLVVMRTGAPVESVEAVRRRASEAGGRATVVPGEGRAVVRIVFDGSLDPDAFQGLPDVERIVRLTRPYGRVARASRPSGSVVRVGGVAVGGEELAVFAGPCAVESREQALVAARAALESGADGLRGGAFKPRTSPYAFQGLGEEGLAILAEARSQTGLPVVTEAVDEAGVALVERYADAIQIGARNMQNYALLRRAGASRLPVVLKRGIAATVEEFLLAAEYVLDAGNSNVILCERGVRTFLSHCRYTLDIAAIPFLQSETHLPVIVDPSHAAGDRSLVPALARAAAAAGADGLLVEIHPDPSAALCDGAQALELADLPGLFASFRAASAVRAEAGAGA